MTAGGKTENADSIQIEIPFARVLARQPKRALRVEQRHEGALSRQPIFQHDAGDIVLAQPARDAVTFGFQAKHFVTAAGTNQDRGSIGILRMINRDRSVARFDFSVAVGRAIWP